MSFRATLVAIIVAAAMLPAALLAVPTWQRLYALAVSGASRELELEARNAAQALRMELTRLVDQAQAVCNDSDVRRGVKSVLFLERADVRLAAFTRDNPLASVAWLLDPDGSAVTAAPETVLASKPPEAVAAEVRRFFARADTRSERGFQLLPFTLAGGPALAVLQPVVGLLGQSGGMLAVVVTGAAMDGSMRRALPAALSGRLAIDGQEAVAGDDDEASSLAATTDFALAAPAGGLLRARVTVREPRARRLEPVRASLFELGAVLIAAVLLCGAVGFMLARWLVGPIAALSAQARAYAAGRYATAAPDARFAEFNEVAATLSTMGREIEAHLAGERARLDAELAALRSQMSPHFLFNTLNGIATLVSVDPPTGAQALAKVADLYRLTLEATGAATAPLTRELQVARLYLELEGLRFGQRLSFAFELKVPAEGLYLPGLLVQTLVENAVKHGIAKARGGGHVRVSLDRRADGFAVLTVANTGAPFRGEVGEGGDGGIGLKNTRQRLDLMYGEAHGFHIGANERGETEVSFAFTGARSSREDDAHPDRR